MSIDSLIETLLSYSHTQIEISSSEKLGNIVTQKETKISFSDKQRLPFYSCSAVQDGKDG